MRVVCIDECGQYGEERWPRVKKGCIYTVLYQIYQKAESFEGYIYPAGIYYILMEMPKDVGYFSENFIPIQEDQKDETTFERNYQKETV